MRIDRTAAAQADRLDAFWDRLDDSLPGPTDTPSARDREEVHLETLVLYLESLKPVPSPTQRGAVRARVEESIGKESTMASPIASPRTSVESSGARTRTRIIPIIRAFDRLAAAALILAVVAALILLGPVRGLLDGGDPGRFAAMLGLDKESSGPDPGSQLSTSIEVRPGDYEGGRVEVGLWEVRLSPGSAMSPAPASGGTRGDTFSFVVSQGSVLWGGGGTERSLEKGGNAGDLAGIDHVRNPNTTPAHLLVLAPMRPDGGFPLTINAWSPDGATASPVDGAAASETDPVLLSSVELNDTAAFQYRVLVSENVLAPGMALGDAGLFGPPESLLRSITVLEGQLAIVPEGLLATPVVAQELVAGDSVRLEADGVWSSDVRVTGPENARVLALLTMPAADNFTLDQTLDSIAPFWGEWTVPASGEVNLAVRKLALMPGGTYRLPADAGVLYHVASGTVDMLNSDSGNTVNVAAGGTVAQIPGTVLAFSNPGSAPVNVIQTLVFDGSLRSIVSGESATNGETALLVEQSGTLPAGEASLMLEVSEYNGENDGGSAGEGGQSLRLITSVDGEVEVSRLGGDAEVVTGPGEQPIKPSLGEGTEIEPGGYLLAQPGAGWSITGASGAPSTGLVLSVSPNLESEGTPVATPASVSSDTIQLAGSADACDIAPITIEHVNDIVATPSAATAPLERSLRNQDGGTTDPATTEGIVAMLQGYTDCYVTGDYTRIYTFLSDQAIRESKTTQDLIEAEYDFGESPRTTTAVEEIVIFPDGRAGARVVVGGEAAYLTFVLEDGQWKTDVWDDSGSGLLPGGTPAD